MATDHRRVRAAGAARLCLQRASGADEPRADARPVPCARRQPADRRDGLRHLLRGSLEPDRRAGRRRRPGSGRRQRPDRRLGRRSRRHQRAFLGQGRGGAAARRQDRRHRSAQEPHRAAGRPASADPHRHRRRAGARGHAHPGARRSGRSRLHRGAHGRVRPARSRGAAALPAGARRRDHRPRRGRHRGFRACLRRREALVHPARRGHDPAGARRRGAARGGAAARRDRRLWTARRRRAAADRGVVRAELRRAAPPVRTGRDPPRQPFAARRRAAQHDRPAAARAVRRGQQPGRDLSRRRQGAPGPRCARICSRSCTTRFCR